MTDIVDRLRSPEVFIDMGGMTSRVAHEAAAEIERLREAVKTAADEIERLRSALRDFLADTPHADHNCGDPDCPVDRARAALRGNGHD